MCMTTTTTVSRPLANSPVPVWFSALVERSRAADGTPPFSDQSLVDLRTGERDLIELEQSAAALLSPTEAEFVVDPDARGQGRGRRLLDALLDRAGDTLLVWAHGDHPAARALAASHHLEPVRELLHLTADLAQTPELSGAPVPPAASIRAFVVGRDEDEWVVLNSLAFASHAEQGSVTRSDLDELAGEDWFVADDFLLLHDGRDALIGYCWLKIEGDTGEFYVVGIDPSRQGEGLGRVLTEAGLTRLRERGVRQAHLYVEGDNLPAVSLYRSLGFVDDTIDVQYRWTRTTPKG